jgi:DNA repair protein RadC
MNANGNRAEQARPQMRALSPNERSRVRLQFLGEQALSTMELLAIILRTGSDGATTHHLAEQLLVRFSDLPELAQASVAELTTVKGIGSIKAVEIKAALELGRRLLCCKPEERPQVQSPADAANLLMPEMMFLQQEHLRLILLNTRNQVLSTPTLYIGNLNATTVRIGEVFRGAIKINAAALILVHNHPSGDPSPSPEDGRVTRQIVEAGKLLGLDVLDHIIIGRQRYVSLKERGIGFG